MFLVYMLPSGEFLWSLFKQLEKAEILVKTTICFHNFLCQTNNTGYCPTGFVDYSGKKGELKEEEWWSLVAKSQGRMLTNISPIRRSRPTIKAVWGQRKVKVIH